MTQTSRLVQSAEAADSGDRARVFLVGPPGAAVWGLAGGERLRRQCARLGATVEDWTGAAPADGTAALIRRDCVLADDVLDALLSQDEAALLDGEESAVLAAVVPAARAGDAARFIEEARWLPDDADLPLPALRPAALVSSFDAEVGGRRTSPVARLVDAENARRTEWDLYTGAFKTVTDVISRFVWPYPALWLARGAVRLRIPANAVSLTALALAVLAIAPMGAGAFGWGLAAAWAMALIDAADGKLARVTVHSSRLGMALNALAQLAAPVWFAAWLYGLDRAGAMAGPWVWIAVLAIGGYAACRLEELWFRRRFGLSLHIWRAPDSWFRLISASRNIHLLVLTVLTPLAGPYWAIAAVAAWTGATLAFRTARLALAETGRRAGPLRSWLEQ